MEETKRLVQLAFREYYYKNLERLPIPSRMKEREFGYQSFNGNMIRHLSIAEPGQLHALLVREAPKGVFVSCAYYEEPSLPMDQKGFKGADLIFDIDAEDLMLPCRSKHDWWECKACGLRGPYPRPKRCNGCGGDRLAVFTWACKECLEAARIEVLKLISILEEDLRVGRSMIKVCFSGNLGYHVEVSDPRLEPLNQEARADLADYVSGNGFEPRALGISPQYSIDEVIMRLPPPSTPGWKGRVMRKLLDEALADGEATHKVAEIYRSLGYEGFKAMLNSLLRSLGSRIDPMVTADIHRIFRMPGSLHGETGLCKLPIDEPWDSDPLVEAVVLGDEPVSVEIDYSPPFSLKGVNYGPFKGDRAKLPLHAAVYLMARGLAQLR